MTETQPPSPPADLTSDPDAFFCAGPDVDLLMSVPPPQDQKHVLEQLGPPPFRKTSFPMMGFLASVYEHVAAQFSGRESS